METAPADNSNGSHQGTHSGNDASSNTSPKPLSKPADASKLLLTAWSILDGYSAWDLDAILAPRTCTCTQKVFPMSLNGPIYTGPDTYRAYYQTMLPLFRNFRMEVLDYAEDGARNKVFFHARASAETDAGPYANEYMWMIRTTEDHGKVEEIKEFVDSAYTVEYLKKMWANMQEQGKTSWG